MIWRLLLWYLVLMFLGWVTFPLTFRLMGKLPDKGYSLSRILGLLFWGFGFWSLGSVGVLQNQPGAIVLVFFLLSGLSVWSGWRQREEIWDWLVKNWRVVLTAEVVFMLGFGFMALVRSADPDATGTEKPMELAFINAILNSTTFPPRDPWLSGYAISYYHFGYIMAGMLAKLTFTSGSIAFNLMLASTFGMSAVGAYGILYNLLASSAVKLRQSLDALFWALFGPLFLLFISNLEAVLEMLHQRGVGWDMGSGASQFWQWINISSLNNPPSPPLTLIPQRFWWWWQASRVIQDIDLLGNVSGLSPIDEFPAFSFVLGDLHPHVLVIPFVMLLIGLSLNTFRGGMHAEGNLLGMDLHYRLDLFFTSAITLGGIAFLNTWDFPVYFALLTGSFLLHRVMFKGWEWERLFEFLQLVIPLGIISLLLYAPFFISFQSQAGGILPNLFYPTRGLYTWLMFGALLIPIFLFFGLLHRKRAETNWGWGILLVLLLILGLNLLSVGLGFQLAQTELGQMMIAMQGETSFGGLLVSALLHRLAFVASLVTLAGLVGIGLSYLVGLTGQQGEGEKDFGSIPFVLLMVVLGGIMVLAPEFVYLRDNFGARMNTVFKFYYQAWMLWSLAAGFAAVVVLKQGYWISKMFVMLIILMGLIYPVLAFPAKTNDFQPAAGYTLDASAYLARQQPDEAAAIQWLANAPDGVVAEAIGGQYSGYARVSTLSGQPAVLGWPGHEGQWRGGYAEVANREPDIRTLYETPDWNTALDIIQRYDIDFVFIGSLEMSTYALNPEKFDQYLEMGFMQGSVRVYVVPETIKE